MFSFLSRLSTQYPRYIAGAATIFAMGAGVFAAGVFPSLKTNNGFNGLGTQSQAVQDAVSQDFSAHAPSGIIMFSAKSMPRDTSMQSLVDTPEFANEVKRLSQYFQHEGRAIDGYYTTYENRFVSSNRAKTFALVTIPGNENQQYQVLSDFQNQAQSRLVTVEIGGEVAAQHQASTQVESDLKTAELITLPVLAVLLLLIFRGVVAAALPLGLGILAIVGGVAMVRLLTSITAIDQYALNVITVLGLGLSVDYSLLMVNRFREELFQTDTVASAVRRTVATSGRTIFFSGLTVIASLMSLMVFPIPLLRSIALGGSSAIFVAVVSALFVLPALLMLLGVKVNAWQLIHRSPTKPYDLNIWHRIGEYAVKYPVLAILLSGGLIASLAWPLHHVQVTSDDYRTLPSGSSAKAVGRDLVQDFGPPTSSINILFKPETNPSSAAGITAIFELTRQLAQLPGITQVTSPTPIKPGITAASYEAAYAAQPRRSDLQSLYKTTVVGNEVLLTATFDGSPTSSQAGDLVRRMRRLEAAGTVEIGGFPAQQVDNLQIIKNQLPWALLIIGISMFVLLGLLLRSILIPFQAILINSLGLLASFGLLVLIFQDGYFTSAQWLSQTGGLSLTIPILIFAIAFGLSMDYSAFIYARMREEIDRGADNTSAIVRSLGRTGGIITAAALLLFVVVAAFASSKIAFLQQVGIGLSVAVLVDAFVIRLLLVPAVMKLFGSRNWYAPAWLRRYKLEHE